MDVSDALKAAENVIRDTISHVLSKKHGADWPERSGMPSGRLDAWKKKKAEEEKSLGRTDPRIIYYADFYDIKTLISKNWDSGLSEIFVKLREIEVLLDILGELRNPEAHRRELLPHEKHLAIGISGRIRTRISEYFSSMQTGESFYPRLECVRDSYGNSWAVGEPKTPLKTDRRLRVGDIIEFSVTGSDPRGEEIEFAVVPCSIPHKYEWKDKGDFSITIDTGHVGDILWIFVAVRSKREYHATREVVLGKIDDIVKFGYEVLPPY